MDENRVDIIIHIDENLSDSSLDFRGDFTPHLIASKVKSANPESEVYYSIPSAYDGLLKSEKNLIIRESADDVNYWKGIFAKTSSPHIAVIKGDSPFFDTDVLNEMSELHTKYLAEFTYSENLPEGFTCEIISGELMNQLPEIKEKSLPLNKVIKSNINQFDVELYYREPDIRDKRISFRLSNLRDKKIMENFVEAKGEIPHYSEIRDMIKNNPELVFTAPSYLEIEITGECSLDCIFCYRNTLSHTHSRMSIETMKKLIGEMKEFSLPYTVCFGGSGEPIDHPDFYALMDLVCSEPLAEQLIVETNGIKADANFKSYLTTSGHEKVKVIINNNGMDKASYQRLHGSDFFDKVFSNIISLNELNSSGERVYIQIMKINETDEFSAGDEQRSYLDKFYDFWEGYKVPIILQKQNTCSGRIKDRRYSDLSPLKRIPCWHLQRDLYVLSDGTVAYCKQDIDGEKGYGNINSTPLKEILKSQKESFVKNYSDVFPAKPDCKNCDEWYTFNF
ncbi:MAG TPA: spiro-SPASM protein [Spirochaetota bacterium]|nr:spiro-SPASM protein [Spirochaetota bacterium]HPR37352.1 spiro-SPASM protein [Spirochaetota bacterium]